MTYHSLMRPCYLYTTKPPGEIVHHSKIKLNHFLAVPFLFRRKMCLGTPISYPENTFTPSLEFRHLKKILLCYGETFVWHYCLLVEVVIAKNCWLSDTICCRDLKSLCCGKWIVCGCRWAHRCRLWKISVLLTSSVSLTTRTHDRSLGQRSASNDPQNTYFSKMSLRAVNQTGLCLSMGIHSRTWANDSINPATD